MKNILMILDSDDLAENKSLGLLFEAQKIAFMLQDCMINVLIHHNTLEPTDQKKWENLKNYGVHEVFTFDRESYHQRYEPDLLTEIAVKIARNKKPLCILLEQSSLNQEVATKISAHLDAHVFTNAKDFFYENGRFIAIRSQNNGYIFQKKVYDGTRPMVITYDKNIFSKPLLRESSSFKLMAENLGASIDPTKILVTGRSKVSLESMDLCSSRTIVAVGRGCMSRSCLDMAFKLSSLLNGTVGCTRPVVDQKIMTLDRQIGQTGEEVSPELLIACGISGANEFMMGISETRRLIAINTDEKARIFDFSDLIVVEDVNIVLPLFISQLESIRM